MKKKNKIMLILCSVFVCIASVLSFLPFVKNDDNRLSVYADTVVNDAYFRGSSINMVITPFSDTYGYWYSHTAYGLKSFDFDIDSNNIVKSFTITIVDPYLPTTSESIPNFYSTTFTPLSGWNQYIDRTTMVDVSDDYKSYNYLTWGNFSNFTNGNAILGVPIGFKLSSVMEGDSCKTNVTFFDKDLNTASFNTYSPMSNLPHDSSFDWSLIMLSERTYYFSNALDFTDNQFYNQGYSAGQSAGYNDGYNKGQSNGYSEGYNAGENVGYNNGYTAGMEDSNQYSFLSLISATIDAPVSYFQSLFNFELLGVNLQGFLTGLFTLCIIVTIVKLCLGG